MSQLLYLTRELVNIIVDDVTSLNDNQLDLSSWLKAWLAILTSIAYALYILTYPPRTSFRRKLSLFILFIPTSYAFMHHQSFLPSWAISDSFARATYIWFAHMSHDVCIIEYSPTVSKENDTFHERFQQARKVLFAYNSSEALSAPPSHSYTRTQFLRRHLIKALKLYIAQALWYALSPKFLAWVLPAPSTPFSSFTADTLRLIWPPFEDTFQWCIVNLCLYESHYSLFALLFVGLRIDEPQEWHMALFRPISTAYSVRRYWGVHWHSYIYNSFSAHVKIVTRNWLSMRRTVARRVLENTLVFAASGLAHSTVRWAQDWDGTGDYAFIGMWYVAQMLPILLESVVLGNRWVRRGKWYLEQRWPVLAWYVFRAIGYAWVVMWFMWCVSKYVQMRQEWLSLKYREKTLASLGQEKEGAGA